MKNKKTLYIIPAIILCLFLNGCRNYQELENLSVVAGIAVDKAQDGEGYLVSLEVIDTSAPIKENKVKSRVIESEGRTVFDAVNQVKKKLFDRPYFGNAQVLIISRKIAESEGIENIIEGFLRDTEPRETIEVTISRGETAKEIITPDNDGKYIYSYEIKKNLDGGKKNSNQLKNMELYKVYNELKRNSGNLLLPAFICAEKKETQEEEKDKIKKETEADGFAIFQKDKLIGWLDYGDVLYYMLINGSVKGSVFAFPLENQAKNNVSLTILKSSSKKSFEVDISGEKKAKINIVK